jgi:hypothetical protein
VEPVPRYPQGTIKQARRQRSPSGLREANRPQRPKRPSIQAPEPPKPGESPRTLRVGQAERTASCWPPNADPTRPDRNISC